MSDIPSEKVEVPAVVLEQTLARLQERRVALEKIVIGYGEAPAGIKEIFELCRGFERAYTSFINESPVAMKIKDTFLAEKGLAGKVKKLPYDKVFKLDNVKMACKQADGYQPSLVAPEKGMRQLAGEALDHVVEPVNSTVQEVYNLLVNAGREAAEKAGQFTEAALMGAMPMCVPNFKNVVMPAIVHALDEWKHDAIKMALMLVDMERSYVTAGFFRHTQHHRYTAIKQAEQMRAALAAKQATGAPKGMPGASGGNKTGAAKFFPSFGAAKDPAASPQGEDGHAEEAKPSGGSGPSASEDFIACYFDKYVSDESARSLMIGAMKWQRRFFVFSESQRMLYYFKGPEDVSKPGGMRGQVNVAECVVEDLDEKGNPRTPGVPFNAMMHADKAQLMIRIRHKDPRGSAVKDHNAIILRAEASDTKATWLAKLRKAAEPKAAKAAPSTSPPQAQQQQGQQPASPAQPGQAAEGAEGQPAVGHAGGESPGTPGTPAPGGAPGAVAGAGPAAGPGAPAPAGFGPPGMPPGGFAEGDLSWAKDAEPVLDTHLGEGSRAFRADHVRDSEGRLTPAPQQLLNPLRMREYSTKHGPNTLQARYDGLLDQFSHDLSLYMQCISDTVIITVPKAIVHCMIRKSEKNLLERLFTVIHHLTPAQMEMLLKEEDSVVLKRKAARAAMEDAKTALFQVQQLLERQSMANAADRKERVTLPCSVFAYADMRDMLSPEQFKYFDSAFKDQNMPECLRFGYVRMPQLPGIPSQPLAARNAASGTQGGPAAGPPGQAGAAPAGGAPGPQLARPSTTPGAASNSGPSMSGGSMMRPPGVMPQRPPPGAPLGAASAAAPGVRRAPPPPPPGR